MRASKQSSRGGPGGGTVRPQVLRLPLPLAARLAAWCELHPQRSRNEVVAELLEVALAQAEQAWSMRGTSAVGVAPDPAQPIYLPTGPFAGFRELVRKHHLRLEHEIDRDEPASPGLLIDYPLGDE